MDKDRKYIIDKINSELEKTPTIYLLYKIHNWIECVNKEAAKKNKEAEK